MGICKYMTALFNHVSAVEMHDGLHECWQGMVIRLYFIPVMNYSSMYVITKLPAYLYYNVQVLYTQDTASARIQYSNLGIQHTSISTDPQALLELYKHFNRPVDACVVSRCPTWPWALLELHNCHNWPIGTSGAW